MFNLKEHSHTRYNILTGEWILVSPHRSKRPWQGKVESLPADERPQFDPSCYLCPGNQRADGSQNPVYNSAFAFTNDFSSLVLSTPEGEINKSDLLHASSAQGVCRVISFSPDHSKTLPLLSLHELEGVIRLWQREFTSLSNDKRLKYIQIFENKGEMMGCSNPHPHGQIWASSYIPVEVMKEQKQQEEYFAINNRSLLADYLDIELQEKERVVFENNCFVVVVPFWATWPFETMIISKRHVISITEFTEEEIALFAEALKELTTKYDNLFEISFPYSAGMHQAPVNSGNHPGWHWHMHFFPPLLRSATVKKFMVGYEMLANPQRDITPENAAERLRGTPSQHYKTKG